MSNNLLIGELPIAVNPAYIQAGDLLAIQRANGQTYQSYIYMSSALSPKSLVQRDENNNFYANNITANLLGTATYAQNLEGGTAGSIPYQIGTNETGMLTVSPGVLLAGTTPSFVTILPSLITSGLTQVIDPSTNDVASLNTALLNIYNHGGSGGSGTVTNVSIATINGLAGTVANPTTTPVISLSTTVTGILKGNGTGISAAIPGTDYVIPSGTVANATNAINATNATNINVTNTAANINFYLSLFNSSTSGNKSTFVSSGILYNPSINVLSANFAGNLNGNATTASKSTNLIGSIIGSIPYQSALDTTSFLPPATGLLLGGITPSYITNLPSSINTNNTTVTDPTTSASNSLETTLLNIYNAHGGGGSGVDTFAVNNASSGFNFSVNQATGSVILTPAISTTGILKGVAGSLQTAIANTDYLTPSGTIDNAVHSTTSTNLSGGVAGSIPYQTAANTTAFITPSVGLLLGGTTPSLITSIPSSITIGSGLVSNPITVTTTGLNNALSNITNQVRPVSTGGTGLSTLTNYAVMCGGSTMQQVSGVGLPGQVLTSNGPGTLPTWQFSGSGTGTVLSFSFNNANGFTGVVTNSTTNPQLTLQTSVASGNILKSLGGALVAATVSDFPVLNQNTTGNAATATLLQTARNIYGNSFNGSADLVGPIAVDFGGSGVSSLVPYRILTSGTTSTGNYQQLTSGLLGQVLYSQGPGSLPIWDDLPSDSGIGPYVSTSIYNKGSFIGGNGTNGQLGFIYTALIDGITGTFNLNNWAIENGLDLDNFNTYSSTYSTALTVTGQYNTFGGYNAGTAPSISGNGNVAYGPFAFTSNSPISSNFGTLFGGSSANGSLTSASFFTGLGFGSLTSLTTGNYNIAIGYQSGADINEGSGNINIGSLGESGSSYNNNLDLSNPQNNNPIIQLSNTDLPFAANRFLATPVMGSGPLSLRALSSSDIPTIYGQNVLSYDPVNNISSDTVILDTALTNLYNAIINGTTNVSVTSLSPTNVNISNPGTNTFDGVTLVNGDLLFLYNQTNNTQNGVYTFNGASSTLTRIPAMNTWEQIAASQIVAPITTSFPQGSIWLSTVGPTGTIGVDPITFTQLPNSIYTGGTGVTISGSIISIGQSVATSASPTFVTVNAALNGNASTATALQTARNIYGNSFNGSADLTQIIASTFGGTGNGFTKFAGAATTEKTYTLPNATCNILTDNALVTVPQGGTGVGSNTAYAVLCGGTTSTGAIQSIASIGTSGQVLTSNGAAALPTMQDINTVTTWVPTDASGAGLTFTAVTARYLKTGNMINIWLSLTFPATANASSVAIGGLPFTSNASNIAVGIITNTVGGANLNTAYIGTSTNNINIVSTNAQETLRTNANFTEATVRITISYFI